MKKTFVLLMLALFTFSISFAQEGKAKKSPAEKAEKVVAKFAKFLAKKEITAMTDTQAADLQNTLAESIAEIRSLKAKGKANPPADAMANPGKKGNPEIRAVKKATKTKIKGILSPAQFEAYKAFVKKGKKKKDKKGKKGGKKQFAPDAPKQ